MRTIGALTGREQQGLEHRRKAQELGISLKEYARKFGLDVQTLYQLRGRLVRKGALFSHARFLQKHSRGVRGHSFYSSPLKEWRKRQHVTQTQLALQCGIQPSSISQLELRRMLPGLALVYRLSQVTGISLERLTLFFLVGAPRNSTEPVVHP
jgi:DNA-binding XRE family transcriptional regulator